MCSLFPCIRIFWFFFSIKSVKKCICVVGFKIALLPVKSLFINVRKGISELLRKVAPKHTTFLL